MNRVLVASIAVILAIATCGRAQAPKPVPDIDIVQHLNEQVPLDLKFRDEAGASVPLRTYFGERPVVLVLAYYRCPRLCSVVLSHLTGSLQKIDPRVGKDFDVVVVSIDPREGPELAAAKKASYVMYYGDAESAHGWHFMTGEEANIKALADAVGFGYEYDPKADQYAHSSGIMILTPDGKIARYFLGLSYPARDMRNALDDAAAGKVGETTGQQVRLLCFSYDPSTGKYTLMTLQLVRVAAGLTVLALGGFLVWSWRRGRSHV